MWIQYWYTHYIDTDIEIKEFRDISLMIMHEYASKIISVQYFSFTLCNIQGLPEDSAIAFP